MNKEGLMTNLRKKFGGLNLSGIVLNQQKQPPKKLDKIEDEAEFKRNFGMWLIETIRSVGKTRKSEPTNPNDMECMVRSIYSCLPSKIIGCMMCSMTVPPWPSVFFFGITHILIHDYELEVSDHYKEMMIREIQSSATDTVDRPTTITLDQRDVIAVASLNMYRVREILGFMPLLQSEMNQGIYYGEKSTLAMNLLMAMQMLPKAQNASEIPPGTMDGLFGMLMEASMKLDPDRWGKYMQSVMSKSIEDFAISFGLHSKPPKYNEIL